MLVTSLVLCTSPARVADIEEFDKEQLFRSLCIDAHVAELYKLKTKKWKRNNNDYRRVRKVSWSVTGTTGRTL